MRTAIFMMPTSFIAKGSIPLSYLFVERNCDGRTTFYKTFAKREISVYNTVRIAKELGMQVIHENGKLYRILAPQRQDRI